MKTKEVKDISNTDFSESLYYQIELTEKYFKKFGKQLELILDLPIKFDELMILWTIKNNDGEIHQRDLAKIILKDRANTGRLLNTLDDTGYIKRVSAKKNNRSANFISITEKGIKIMNEVLEVVRPVFEKLDERISKDEIELIKKSLINFRKILKEIIDIHI